MRKVPLISVLLISAAFLAACSSAPPSGNGSTDASPDIESRTEIQVASSNRSAALPDAVVESYYAGQRDPAFEYLHHSSIQRFLAMWVEEETGDIEKPEWNYDSFTKIDMLDHDFARLRPGQALYCCTFSDGDERYGYVIVEYIDDGPAISNLGVTETTPYLYDLKSSSEAVSAALSQTDIDLATAQASRVYLYDNEKKRADQVIRFTDGKGDNYIVYFGGSDFTVEKWDA